MNYAVLRSAFGDYWVGKTNLAVREGSIFSTFEEAREVALDLSEENPINQIELEEETEETAEEVLFH